VTNLNDAGMGSLRQAILDTPAGGSVDFQAGLSGTITLTSGQLAVSKDLTISGPGADLLTVSGNHASRVFNVAATFTVSIAGLTIADGLATDLPSQGGGILNRGTLTVTGSTLSGNTALYGGGIYNAGTLAARGLVTIDGDFFQTANGTLDVGIGGLTAGTDYSQLGVTGLATLGGTLQVKMTNGYRPQPGDSFQPLLWGQSQGAFARYTGANSLFRFSYDEIGLTLVAN
jgi:hypothetical protein